MGGGGEGRRRNWGPFNFFRMEYGGISLSESLFIDKVDVDSLSVSLSSFLLLEHVLLI